VDKSSWRDRSFHKSSVCRAERQPARAQETGIPFCGARSSPVISSGFAGRRAARGGCRYRAAGKNSGRSPRQHLPRARYQNLRRPPGSRRNRAPPRRTKNFTRMPTVLFPWARVISSVNMRGNVPLYPGPLPVHRQSYFVRLTKSSPSSQLISGACRNNEIMADAGRLTKQCGPFSTPLDGRLVSSAVIVSFSMENEVPSKETPFPSRLAFQSSR